MDEEVLAEVVGGAVGSPSMVALGDFPDEVDRVSVLPQHEDVHVDAADCAFLVF